MKLLVIVLCLLSERFLIHSFSSKRFNWYPSYFKSLQALLARMPIFNQPWVLLVSSIAAPLMLTMILFYLLSYVLFGFLGFIFHLVILFYCLGPDNPFYPIRMQGEQKSDEAIASYFVAVNTQLFAPLFWYIVAGPIVLLGYRLIYLNIQQNEVSKVAQCVFDVLNWLPVRMLAVLFLFVGHFQAGFQYLSAGIFAKPSDNNRLLSQSGLSALREGEHMPDVIEAERMVEHALIVLLVIFALITIVAWV